MSMEVRACRWPPAAGPTPHSVDQTAVVGLHGVPEPLSRASESGAGHAVLYVESRPSPPGPSALLSQSGVREQLRRRGFRELERDQPVATQSRIQLPSDEDWSGSVQPRHCSQSSVGYSPKQQAQLRSTLDLPHRLEWDTSAYFVGALRHGPVPSYTRLDTRLGWRVGESIEFSVAGQNLLTPRHFEFGDGISGPRHAGGAEHRGKRHVALLARWPIAAPKGIATRLDSAEG